MQRLRGHDTEVDCEYAMLGGELERLLHLSTFGSDDRASERKSSQSIQLDVERARQLIAIIEECFPQLARD